MESNGKAKVDKFLIASGFIGPIIFFLMIYFLFPLLFPGYDFTNQYISELGAIDSPVMIAANVIGFSLFGVFIMLFAIGIFRSKVMGKLGKASSFFIFGTGILMFLVGVFVCDAGCMNYSLRGQLHEIVSDYQFIILAIGLVLFAVEAAFHKGMRWLTPVILVFGLITLVLAYFSLLFQGDLPNPGLLQRAAIGIPFLLVMIMAITLYRVQFKGKEKIKD